MISVQTEDFNVAAEYTALRHQAGDAGAIVLFTGLVRELYGAETEDSDGSDKTQGLFLEHYPGMTEKQLEAISQQASKRWPFWACVSSIGSESSIRGTRLFWSPRPAGTDRQHSNQLTSSWIFSKAEPLSGKNKPASPRAGGSKAVKAISMHSSDGRNSVGLS